MQKKFLLLITVILLAGLFVGNWIYGNILAKKIEDRITKRVESLAVDVDVQFDQVKVNPLFSKLRFKGLSLTDAEGHELLLSDEVYLDMPYTEAMRILKSSQVDDLKSFKLRFSDMSVYVKGADDRLLVDELLLAFKGHITKGDIQNLDKKFPSKKQSLRIELKGGSFAETPWMDALGFTPEQIVRFNQLDRLAFDLDFNPDKKILTLNDLQLLSPIVTYQADGSLSYKGDGMSNMQADVAHSSFELKLNEEGISWGNPETTGRFTLKGLAVQMDGAVQYKDQKQLIQQQKTNFLLEDLSIEFEGEQKAKLEAQTALLGLKMDQLSVDRLAIQSELKDNRMVIESTQLKSSLLNADLDAIITIDSLNQADSQIESAKLIISDLAPGLQNGLSTFEMMTGQTLPRKGKAIVLEMSGPVSRPNIKGIRY